MLTRVAARLFNTPLLVNQDYLATVISALGDRLDVSTIEISGKTIDAPEMEARATSYAPSRERKPYHVVDGVAVIDISGTLVNKNGYVKPYSGLLGYDGIETQFAIAINDESIHSILLDINSPGGEVAGCFDLVDLIASNRGNKTIVAFAGEMATSAAYALASAAEKVYLPRTGIVGSIGVVAAHRDISQKLNNEGVRVTLIHSGEHKVDGNSYEPLPESVQKDIQSSMDDVRMLFAKTVSLNRGVDVAAVLATEAKLYTGSEAVKVGLADGVSSFNEVLTKMSKDQQTKEGMQASAPAKTAPQASLQEASAEKPTPAEAISATAVVEACHKAGVSFLSKTLIDQQLSPEGFESAMNEVSQIRDLCTASGVDPQPVLESYGNGVELARQCLSAATTDDTDTENDLTQVQNTPKLTPIGDLYRSRNRQS